MRSSWRRTTLGEFTTLQRGHDLPRHQRRAGSVPVMGSFGVTGYHDEARAPGPGVTVGRSGASFGVVSYSTVDFWPLNTTLYVEDYHGNDPRFAYYLLTAFDFERYNSGSAQASLNRNFIHPIEIEVPPIDDQRAIARVLGTLDDKIALNRRMNDTLEEVALVLFKKWWNEVQGTCVPERVEALEKAGVLVVGDGYRAKNSEMDATGVPFIRAGNLKHGRLVVTGADLLRQDRLGAAGHKRTRLGDVAFTSKGTVGRLAMVRPGDEGYVYSPQVCFWRSLDRQRLDPRFLYQWMKSRRFVAQVAAVKGQTDMAEYVSLRDQRAMRLDLPPAAAQAEYAEQVTPIHERIGANLRQNETLAALRDALLPGLLSGAIRVRNAL